MASWKFSHWCYCATMKIKYRPDRKAVSRELQQHIEDRYESFISRGIPHEIAVEKTLEAMGDPKVLASQLAAIHRPFWPYLMVVSRCILIVMIMISIVSMSLFFYDDPFSELSSHYTEIFSTASPDRFLYVEPDGSDSADGYTYTLKKAAWLHDSYEREDGSIKETNTIYVLVEVYNPRPWAESPKALDWFWAEDSLGNYYYNGQERLTSDDRCVYGNTYKTGFFTYALELRIQNPNTAELQEARWLDLRYDRSGRDITLRIDMTGGDGL